MQPGSERPGPEWRSGSPVNFTAPNGCIGLCCVLLELGNEHTHAELKATASLDPDRARVADMLVPLTDEQADERARRFNLYPKEASLVPGIERFQCRHWNEETGLCREYDQRPRMCHKFPAGPCPYPGCNFVRDQKDGAEGRTTVRPDRDD